MKKTIVTAIITFMITCVGCSFIHSQYPKIKIVHDTTIIHDTIEVCPDFISQSPKEGLKKALIYHGIKHPDIVYAQAVLETGNFTSGGCTKDHNLFGIMSKSGHVKFKHWVGSVQAYKKWVQYKHLPNENYFSFLSRIGYAADPQYEAKLQIILKRNSKSQNHEI